MNKRELIERVSSFNGFTKSEVAKYFEAIFSCIERALIAGEDFKLANFGTFSIADCSQRRCRSGLTGELINIKPRRRVRFKASPILEEKLNN